MNCNKKDIGQRIKEERKEAGYSQKEFAEKLGYSEESRQSIAKWEGGKALPPIETLLEMCELFNCEPGYLLGQFDCKHHETADIQDVTGLSEKAINKLNSIKNNEVSDILITLNKLIMNDRFVDFLCLAHLRLTGNNKSVLGADEIDRTYLARIMNCSEENIDTYLDASLEMRMILELYQIICEISGKPKSAPRTIKKLFNLK